MIQKILENSRYLILIAVIGAYLIAAMVIIYDALLVIHTGIDLFTTLDLSVHSGRQLVLEGIEGLDIFLLGTAFFIVALGLYELFIKRSTGSPVWLHVRDLDDLKARLLGVVIVVMSVFFLEQVINWDGKSAILNLGIAEALMIGAITLAITVHQRANGRQRQNLSSEEQDTDTDG
ncbi:MAG TPA: YqhA family protein [Ktedonobacteraceae bacterium]